MRSRPPRSRASAARPALAFLAVLALGASASCRHADVQAVRSAAPSTVAPSTTEASDRAPTSTASTTSTPSSSTTAPPTTVSSASPATTASPFGDGPAEIGDRNVTETAYRPYGTAAGLTLHHPGDVVEVIGFHQSNHEGAQAQTAIDSAAPNLVLPSRSRESDAASAADIVIRPGTELRAVVSGVVDRGSAYTLYCDVVDEYVVIVPDGAPHVEVKMLHMVGLRVRPGDRVEAGVTAVADSVHSLPFRSQVDDRTGEPSWGHVHVEVIDTTIPNVPNGNSGSDDC